jgi:autotransporter adhesin
MRANSAVVHVNGTDASLTNRNGRGVDIDASSTVISGGTSSAASSLALDSGGATFGGSSGQPITVTGVANGVSQYDAVNVGQMKQLDKELSGGIASTVAIANIPQVDESKRFAVGIGAGSYNSKGALAIGASFRPVPNAVVKISAGKASSGDTAFGVGAGMSW